jgi:hypothetical protein
MARLETLPTGIEDRHVRERQGIAGHASPVALVVLALVISAGFAGVYGGESVVSDSGERGSLSVQGPHRIRNGEFFEMRLTVEAHAEIAQAVVAVDPAVWRDITVNTFIPAPTEEEAADGEFRFGFGALQPGDRLDVKVDLQINPDHPPRVNRGAIRLLDGEEAIAAVDYELGVLP